jgi:hypothetical protein
MPPLNAVSMLKQWFDKLDASEREEVLEFLYGKRLLRRGMYIGPYPGQLQEGLHVGPTPASTTASCPTCGRPY